MRITTLLENHPHPDSRALQAEHGLSFYLEVDGHVYMSDVGQSGKFADNAAHLGVNLIRVEAVVISHHHYDHGGGLGRFFRENETAQVYLRKLQDAFYIAEDPSGAIRTIGLDDGLLRRHQERVVGVSEGGEIFPGLHLVTEIPKLFPKPGGDQRLKIKFGAEVKPDPFAHELVTVIEQDDALVILTGCAHNGVLNMIAATRKALPNKPIKAVVGGFHLHHEAPSTVRWIGEKLLEMDIPSIVTGHCTGDDAVLILEEVLGERLQRLYTGLVMEY
jgi:7,8-dihydropterin-6-yl-methyl-4-(beta-D-ribofuranosyl)aminobenzene 5'-phosphate synthase